jgi:thioredoxin-like negative regulator of GroEL
MKNLVVFKAAWCQPCKGLSMVLANTELGIPVSTIDVDEDLVAVKEYSVTSVPTLLLIEDNQVIKRKTGSMTAQQLKDFVA